MSRTKLISIRSDNYDFRTAAEKARDRRVHYQGLSVCGMVLALCWSIIVSALIFLGALDNLTGTSRGVLLIVPSLIMMLGGLIAYAWNDTSDRVRALRNLAIMLGVIVEARALMGIGLWLI